MKGYRNRFRSVPAMLMCVVFLMTGGSIPALAEKQAATPTDLIGTEESFEQNETVNGVRIIVTAEPGVFAAGTRLSIRKTDSAAFTQAAEATLESEKGNSGLIVHEIYSFSGAQINGTAHVRLEKLRLKDLQEQYPDAGIRVFVLRYDEAARELRDKAQKVSADVSVDNNTVAFDITELGLYDIAAAVQVPEETQSSSKGTEISKADGAEGEEQQSPKEELTITAEEKSEPITEGQNEREKDKHNYQMSEGATSEILSGIGKKSQEIQPRLQTATVPEDKVAAFVARCYELILGRQPDASGLTSWADSLKSKNVTAAEVVSGFLNSQEFTEKRKTAEELVEILYRTMLNRAPDRNGKTDWVRMIVSGANMNQLINGFCGSQEFTSLCAEYGIQSGKLTDTGGTAPVAYSQKLINFVSRCYREALGREADPEGLHSWCMVLASKQSTYKAVATGFVFSEEMRIKNLNNAEFVKTLYRLYMGREADPTGLEAWTAALDQGTTREQVNEGFANSTEFAGIVMSFNPEVDYELEEACVIESGMTELFIRNGSKVQMEISPELAGEEKDFGWASSDGKILVVDRNGEIFGNYPGKAVLTVTSPKGKTIASINVTVQANYRAVLFSESTYAEGTLKRNRGDVRLMKNMLASVTGPDGGKYVVYSFDDLVANEIYNKTESLLIAPSRDGDVSIFFFAGHGDYRSKDPQYAGRLWCRKKQTWVELPELAKMLSCAKGKVIVLLESCGPGAALISWSSSETAGTGMTQTDDPEMSRAIISAFADIDPGLTVYQPDSTANLCQADSEANEKTVLNTASGSNLFLTEKFIVMVASGYLKSSYSIGTDTYNLFPYGIAKGVGTSGAMPADTEYGNGDGLLTVNELFKYVYQYTKRRQIPLVYPENSSYVLFKR